MSKKQFYAVLNGRKPGLYTQWAGENGAKAQVQGFPGAKYKGFATREQAKAWLQAAQGTPLVETDRITLYTDGACIRNPGPGGYGVIIQDKAGQTELSGGFRLTTNNRMELIACIVGLEALQSPIPVTLYSDSAYVVQGINRGWARRWRKNGWWRNKTSLAKNPDLWDQLLDLCEPRPVEFVWVRGHTGHPENERCDHLAVQAACQPNLPPDPGFENPRLIAPPLFEL